MPRVHNHCIKTVFRKSFTPSVSTRETLLEVPSTELYNDAIEVKIVIKIIKAKELVSITHSLFRYDRSKSQHWKANSLILERSLATKLIEYSKQEINHTVEHNWIKRRSLR